MKGAAAHGTESRYRWELKNGGSCDVCKQGHSERIRVAKVDEAEWRSGWVKKGLILVPAGPRPIDLPSHFGQVEPKAPQPIKHGTDTGYGIHKRRKEEACEPCKAAHRRAWHDRRAAAQKRVMTRQERLAKGVAA